MPLSSIEVTKLKHLIRLANELLAATETKSTVKKKAAGAAGVSRQRRSGKELIAFRKMLKAERKRGVAVADLAREHGVSTAYIYQLG